MTRPTCRCPSVARTVPTRCPSASCASTWRRTPPRWCTWAVPRAALPPRPSRSSTTTRCGTPLIELVTEPDLRTPEEARLFMEKLRRIFVTLGISDCSMEKGSMRCDGNVSLRRRGETKLGTKTELKNLNSFKSLHDGLAYEICRQAEVLEEGGIIYQETRHWEPSRKRTVVMRVKETGRRLSSVPRPRSGAVRSGRRVHRPLPWRDPRAARCQARPF